MSHDTVGKEPHHFRTQTVDFGAIPSHLSNYDLLVDKIRQPLASLRDGNSSSL